MSRIRVKNFGPIKEGFLDEDGWIDISKVTVFIGNQGSGKSTLAKLVSCFIWMEKALVRGDFSEKNFTTTSFKKHFSYQNIDDYFKDDTSIEYQGKAYHISFLENKVVISKNPENGYAFPKIMYVPSERNFVSSVQNVSKLKGLPSTLYTFSDEFLNAVQSLKGALDLPINEAKFEYQELNKLAWVVGSDYKIKLSVASSGFQSFVPLYVVTNYLSNSLNGQPNNAVNAFSIEEEKRIRKEIEDILSNPNISDEIKRVSLEVLSSKFTYSAFINIVEEPEQNLFPSSQKHILDSLLMFNNGNPSNGLIITTHSPYIINFLSIAIQGAELKTKIKEASDSQALLEKLEKIVPIASLTPSDSVMIYELSEKSGTIKKLSFSYGIPSDKNYLNDFLKEGNLLFDSLLEIEEEL